MRVASYMTFEPYAVKKIEWEMSWQLGVAIFCVHTIPVESTDYRP